ncbi:MAG: glycosyltransferase family 92 protein, partial [Alphaproteobacteria bacterium]|nr:glycosyltransferase family 92 protein [Alphaproteobacteria bacterium]
HILLPYISQGIVIYRYYPGKAMQMPCYNEFLQEYGDKNEWVAFVDIDEFIIPMENATIPEFLADYKEYPGVGINWVSYDSNGHKKKPEGGVLENYTRVHYDENLVPFHLIKSISQPCRISKIINPHFCLYKNNELAVNENKEPIGGELKARAYISPFSVNKIRINHYYCKSKEEAEAKVMRGTSDDGRRKDIPADTINFPDYKYDYTAYKFVTQLNPDMAEQEEWRMAWLRFKNMFISLKHKLNQSQLYDYIDETWYFEQYPDAKESGMSAAEHYMNIGWRKGYNPSIKFDTLFYLKKYKDVAKADINPLLHYINSGKKEGRLTHAEDTTPPTTPTSPNGNGKKSSLDSARIVKGPID